MIAGLLFKFIIKGTGVEAEDGRVSIVLEKGERNFRLNEMRALLTKHQQMINYLANNNMDGFTITAKKLSEGSKVETQQKLIGKNKMFQSY